MKKTKQTAKKSTSLFFSGVIILTFANILIKILGVTLKIPLSHILGDEGMGYYNTAYDIYVWFYMISTAGLPVAISILISESRAKGNIREAKKIYRITMTLFVIIGLLGMFIMMGGAKLFAAAYEFTESYIAIIAIAPTLFFICIASAIRGYFQGYQEMIPTAGSQIIESLGKMILGILFACIGINMGYSLPVVAAMTILGLTIGVAFGMLFLCIKKLRFNPAPYDEQYLINDGVSLPVRSTKELVWVIAATAIPITISSSVMSFTSMIDGMILSRRLQGIGYTELETLAMFGNYKTLAISMFNMPPVLIYPISYSVIPLLSASIAGGERKKIKLIINSVLKTASLIIFPCMFGLSFLSEPILKLLFADDSAETAAPLLSVLALSLFFVAMLSVTNAILQAYKFERKPIISLLAGSAVKLISSYVLIGTPSINIFGAPIGTFLCYLTICLLNFYFIKKYVHVKINVMSIVVKPLICGVICGGAAWILYNAMDIFLPSAIATVLAIILAAAIYVIAIFTLKCITKTDLEYVPKGNKIYSVLKKVRLMG